MNIQANPIVNRIADSVLLLAIGRVSMAMFLPVMGLLAYLWMAYLDERFAHQDDTIATVEEAVQDAKTQITVVANRVTGLDNRTTGIEAARTEARRAADIRNDQILNRLDRSEQAVLELSKQIATLTAIMQTRGR